MMSKVADFIMLVLVLCLVCVLMFVSTLTDVRAFQWLIAVVITVLLVGYVIIMEVWNIRITIDRNYKS